VSVAERLREEAAASLRRALLVTRPQRRPLRRRRASATRWSSSACCGRPSACSTRSTRPRRRRARLGGAPHRVRHRAVGAGRGGDHPLQRLLVELRADTIHVLSAGRIVPPADRSWPRSSRPRVRRLRALSGVPTPSGCVGSVATHGERSFTRRRRTTSRAAPPRRDPNEQGLRALGAQMSGGGASPQSANEQGLRNLGDQIDRAHGGKGGGGKRGGGGEAPGWGAPGAVVAGAASSRPSASSWWSRSSPCRQLRLRRYRFDQLKKVDVSSLTPYTGGRSTCW